MKNVIKKIVSVAMAFTLLGTGVAISNSISPESNNTLVASARCPYCGGGREYESTAYRNEARFGSYPVKKGNGVTEMKSYVYYVPVRHICRKCYSCNAFLYWWN